MIAKLRVVLLSKLENMENSAQITIGMLYEMLKDFKRDMRDFKNEVYRRFESVERKQDEDHKMLMKLWEQRNGITIKLSGKLLASQSLIILVASTLITIYIHFALG